MSAEFAAWLDKPVSLIGRRFQPSIWNRQSEFFIVIDHNQREGTIEFRSDQRGIYTWRYPYQIVDGEYHYNENGDWYTMRWLT